jgi:putative oxidoreductase
MSTLIASATPSLLGRGTDFIRRAITGLNFLQPVADLGVRLFAAKFFFDSGLSKIQSFDTTIALFENEYHVPFLPPVFAATMGTFTELFFPVLLAFGFGARFAAFVLFFFNIIAVISYPDLGPAGIAQHQVFGLLLLVTLLHGPGRISIDHFIAKRFAS